MRDLQSADLEPTVMFVQTNSGHRKRARQCHGIVVLR